MITTLLFNILLFPINALVDALPHMELVIPTNVFEGLNSILCMLGFVFPIKGLLAILATSISINMFYIMWALVLRLKSFIPTEGN